MSRVPSLLLLEIQGAGIDAEALTARAWAVRENVAEMCPALLAVHFDAAHAVGGVLFRLDVAAGHWLGEARPTRSGIELRVGGEERRTATDAGVDAVLLVVPVGAGERALGALFAGNMELLRSELLAPLLWGLADLVGHARNLKILASPLSHNELRA